MMWLELNPENQVWKRIEKHRTSCQYQWPNQHGEKKEKLHMLLEVHIFYDYFVQKLYIFINYLFVFISRKNIMISDYDSELVDGKYVTSVPIVNPEDEAEEAGNDADGLFIFFSTLFTFWSIFFSFIFQVTLDLRIGNPQEVWETSNQQPIVLPMI